MTSANTPAKNELPAAQAISLLSLVSYQDGAVVSRTLLKRPTGTLTVFAFDEGQSLSEHTSPFDAIAQILEGETEISISGKLVTAKSGEAVLLPANQPHGLKAIRKFKMLLTMIRS
jgi:quercetin dioxygenase-like cupin family protein